MYITLKTKRVIAAVRKSVFFATVLATLAECDAGSKSTLQGDNSQVGAAGYVSAGEFHGYAWTVSWDADGVSGTVITPAGFENLKAGETLCVQGTVAAAYESGAALSVNTNQAIDGGTVSTVSPKSDGIHVTVNNLNAPLRVQLVDANNNTWCSVLSAPDSKIEWSDFSTTCWDGGGDAYNREPIKHLEIVVSGDVNKTIGFDFCLLNLVTYSENTNQQNDTDKIGDESDSDAVPVHAPCFDCDGEIVCGQDAINRRNCIFPRCNIENWYYAADTQIMFPPEIEATYPECKGKLPAWFWDNMCFTKVGELYSPASHDETPCQYFGGGDDAYCPCVGEGRQWAVIMWDTREAERPNCGSASKGCEYIMPDDDDVPIDSGNSECSSCIQSCQGISNCCTGTGCICQEECVPPMPDCTGTGLSLHCDGSFCLCM